MRYPDKSLVLRLTALLNELDKLDQTEELDELNATLEDVIMIIEEAKIEDEDWEEQLEDAFDELDDLRVSYSKINGMFPYSERLKDIIDMGRN